MVYASFIYIIPMYILEQFSCFLDRHFITTIVLSNFTFSLNRIRENESYICIWLNKIILLDNGHTKKSISYFILFVIRGYISVKEIIITMIKDENNNNTNNNNNNGLTNNFYCRKHVFIAEIHPFTRTKH